MIKLNHHAAAMVPYHIDLEGRLYLVLEQKDPNYKKPYFDNGLNFIGGNWEKGKNEDKSPEETLVREIKEEFWQVHEKPESLGELLSERFLECESQVSIQSDEKFVKRMKVLSDILQTKTEYAADYIVNLKEPLADLKYGLTVFTKELEEDEFFMIKLFDNYFKGKLTTDNLRYGSRINVVSLDEINQDNLKFSWGYDHVINDLIDEGKLPKNDGKVIRTLNLVSIEKINYPLGSEKTLSGCSTYNGFEDLGFRYKNQ